ncbi:hypothetical protein SAMN02927900_01855 [Rhizobium mongolense subsp. loessense]|uniref:Uncharacterized protein n=1 Tax=Rhizobium mongolense subsp. loessense TaxID=158890 RepID=A0A1G4QUB3_9HYPH|nr:hypothetical protein SAMN02927900_01855 [Rhizobium mongolense subsp. loessense]
MRIFVTVAVLPVIRRLLALVRNDGSAGLRLLPRSPFFPNHSSQRPSGHEYTA